MRTNWPAVISRLPTALAFGLIVTSVAVSLLKIVRVQAGEFAFGTGVFVISLIAFWGVSDRPRDLR